MKRKDLIGIIICVLCAITVGFGSIGIYRIISEPAQNQVEIEVGEKENPYSKNVSPYRNCNSPHVDVYYN